MEILAVLVAASPKYVMAAFFIVCLFSCIYAHVTARFEPGSVGDEVILDHHEEMISK